MEITYARPVNPRGTGNQPMGQTSGLKGKKKKKILKTLDAHANRPEKSVKNITYDSKDKTDVGRLITYLNKSSKKVSTDL